jgi:RimJ/RimL family protein N-acetyltransferase
MYIYKNIGFRPIEENELELIRKNHNEFSTLLNLGDPSLISSLQQKDWWEKISKSRTNTVFSIVLIETGEIIGVWRLQYLDSINKNCEVGLDIFSEFRKKGFAKMGYEMLLEYLFDQYNLNCVYLRVAEFNTTAIELYKKVGFRQSGTLPKTIFRNGRYWDNLIFYFLADDFRKGQ